MKKYTYSAKDTDNQGRWCLVDAENAILGRLASSIAARLRGKHNPLFTPHVDTGDWIIVINADKVALTGRKWDQKNLQEIIKSKPSTTGEQIEFLSEQFLGTPYLGSTLTGDINTPEVFTFSLQNRLDENRKSQKGFACFSPGAPEDVLSFLVFAI